MDHAVRTLRDTNGVDRVLMNGLQLTVVLGATAKIHLTEHIQRALLTSAIGATALLTLNWADDLPSGLATLEAEWFAVLGYSISQQVYHVIHEAMKRSWTVTIGNTHVASSNDLVLPVPDHAGERQQSRADINHSTRRLLRCTRVDNGDAAIM